MNADVPQPPPEDREARLTALLLGELPANEAEVLHAEIAADPELARLFGRLRVASELTRATIRESGPKETTGMQPLQLSPERRAALLARFREAPANVVPLPERLPVPAFDRRELLALAAMLVALLGAGAVVFPAHKAGPTSSMAGFTAGLSPESLPENAGKSSTPAVTDSEPRAIRGEIEPGRKLVEDEIVQAVPQVSLGEPMLAKRYGLNPAANATFHGRISASTLGGKPDANAVQVPEATRPVSAGDVATDLALVQEPRGGSRPSTDASVSRGLAGANFDSRLARAGSNGRESALAQNQIVLPPPEQRENWEDRPAVNLFFEQAPKELGAGVGAGGGANGNRWFLTQTPNAAGAKGNAPTAVGLGFSPDGSGVSAAGALATPTQAASELMEKGQLDDAGVRLVESSRSNPELDATRYNLAKELRLPEESKQQDVGKDKRVQVERTSETAEGFGGGAGIRPNYAGFQQAPPPAPAGVPLDSPAPAVVNFTASTDGAVRELSTESVSSKRAIGVDRLSRAGRSVTDEDRKAGVTRNESLASTEPSPGLDVRGEIVAAAPSINGPEPSMRTLRRDPSGVTTRDFEGLELGRYKVKADGPVDSLSATKSQAGSTREQADKQPPNDARKLPSQTVVTDVQAGATAEPQTVTTLSGREDFGQKVDAKRLRQAPEPAVAAPATRKELQTLADFSAGQGVAIAGKPAALFGYVATPSTNAAPPTFGDAFGVQPDVNAAKAYVEQLTQRRERLDGEIAKSSGVEIIEPATADSGEKTGLFAKLRQTLGGDATRTARLKIEKDTRDSGLLDAAATAVQTYDPYYLLSEQEVIRSRKILGEAAKRLNLSTAAEDGYRQLEGKVSVNQFRNTSIAEIQVKDPDPAKAAAIANAVAQVYAEYRNSSRTERNGRLLAKVVAEHQAQLAQPPPETPAPESDKPLPKLAPGAPEPQPEVLTAENAFSTFSLNVSDVSFKLAAASLEKGQMPDPATVRTEEFINAFDYHDPEPVGAAPISFTWERARYPFAHDRDLLRFSVKTAASGRQSGRPLNLVLLLDNSGSMERADRVRIRQECLRVLAGQLQPQDRVSVVAFARSAHLWVDALPGSQAAELPGRVGELTPDGGTNLEEALRLAYRTAARHFTASGVNRVVLLTDGAANLGDVQPDSLKQQVEANRRQGIALDCFGIGWEGFNDELLEVLSRNGDGRYGFVNTPEAATSEFAGQLVGALQVAASDVKVQVEWNPRRVTGYRQLGYAKHQLTKEQFRDNTVDAAEIGAAEAGNALYTAQVNPSGEGPLGTVRVRFRVPGTGDYREHEWPLNYSGPAGLLEQAGPALRLAGCASAFSEWLVSSPHAAEITPDRLLTVLTGVTEAYAADPRPKQFELMLRQAKNLTGK